MFCGSASGDMIAPYVVYKSDHLWQSWMEGGPPLTRYNRSKSGWFDVTIFADWFSKTFVPHVRKKEGPVVLIGDNLASHFSTEVLKTAEENNIIFCCLPKNSTHICQPLDVGVYGPLKKKWRRILDSWKQSSQKKSQTITKEKFPYLLKKLFDEVAPNNHCENLVSAFRKTGISPFNPAEVLSRLPDFSTPNINISTDTVSDTLVDILKEMRYGSDNTEKRKKRSKIDVAPGKSIGLEDLNKSLNEGNDVSTKTAKDKTKMTNKKKDEKLEYNTDENKRDEPGPSTIRMRDIRKKRKKELESDDSDISSNSSADVIYMESSDDETLETLVTKEIELNESESDYDIIETEFCDKENTQLPKCDDTIKRPERPEDIVINMFVLVEFIYNKNTKKEMQKTFVAQIVDIMQDKYKISCLREYRESKNTFIFPHVPDEIEIRLDQIKQILSNPVISRGRHTFQLGTYLPK